ncbi:MAG: hypothetical protein QXO47_03290 [Thermoproteota archaeon]
MLELVLVLSINPDAAVFTRKLFASIEQRIMLEKALDQVKVDSDWNLPDSNKEWFFLHHLVVLAGQNFKNTVSVY